MLLFSPGTATQLLLPPTFNQIQFWIRESELTEWDWRF
jgi:hypothetical protein